MTSATALRAGRWRSGEGLPMVGKLLGHTRVQTTARYAHLARDTAKTSAARSVDSVDSDLNAAETVRPAG